MVNKDTFVGFRGAIAPVVPSWICPWFCVRFIAPWWRNRCFQRPQRFQRLNRSLFRSSPVVMNLWWRLKEYWQKNRRQRWDICEESTVWHFVTRSTGLKSVKSGISSHFSESRDPSCVSSAKYIPNVPGENSKLRPLGYSLHQLCPARGQRAECGPFEGFVHPSLGLRQSKSILYTDNLSLIWSFWIWHFWCWWSSEPVYHVCYHCSCVQTLWVH